MVSRTLAVVALCGVVLIGCSNTEDGTPAAESTATTPEPSNPTPETPQANATTADAASGSATACSLVEKADWQAVLGPDVQVEAVSPVECKANNMNTGEYQILLGADAASEMATRKQMADFYKNPLQPLPGIGDEAFTNSQGLSIFVTRGGRFAEINASVVLPAAPMDGKAGAKYIAEKVAAKM